MLSARLATGERRQVARLFHFFMLGEQLAHNCAQKQSRLFSDPLCRRFLRHQARQEHVHARIFRAGIGILQPRGMINTGTGKLFTAWENELATALDNGRPLHSLVGMQIVFEGLAETALEQISAGFHGRKATFNRVRQIVLGQERAHHNFGARTLQRCMSEEDTESLRDSYRTYMDLAGALVYSVSDLFASFDEDPASYLQQATAAMPACLTGYTQ